MNISIFRIFYFIFFEINNGTLLFSKNNSRFGAHRPTHVLVMNNSRFGAHRPTHILVMTSAKSV
jgi:hypothetical protein